MKKNVTWWEFNNIVPIITSAVFIALSFAALMTRVAILESKVDTIISFQSKTLEKYDVLSIKVARLEAGIDQYRK